MLVTWKNDSRPILISAVLWLTAACVYLLCEAIAAGGFPGYSYASYFISDLGVPYKGNLAGRELNSTLAIVMNSGGFVLHGILFALAAVTILPAIKGHNKSGRLLLILAIIHAVGSCLVATVHGGNREVENGTYIIHFIGATMAIVGGNLAALTFTSLSRHLGSPDSYRVISRILIGIAVLGIGLLIIWPHAPTSGVFERCCVYSIMAWELVTASYILAAIYRRERVDSVETLVPQRTA